MKRYFFFALFFPPAFMDLMLVAARPANLMSYFVAGYVVAIVPAVLIAFVDEMFERHSLSVRTALCSLAGGFLSVALFSLAGIANGGISSVWLLLQIIACGAVVAAICVLTFCKMGETRVKAQTSV
jgi:hypothetical protein